jgi:MscS family membrane protein
MQSFLQSVFFDNTIQDYLILAAVILSVILLKRYISTYFANLLFKLFHRKSWQIDSRSFINLIKGPIHVFLIMLVAFLALDKLNFPAILTFRIHHTPFRQVVDSAANAIIIIAFIWLLLRLIDVVAMILEQKTHVIHNVSDNQIVVFFKDFFKVIIFLIGILLVIRFTFYKDIFPLLTGFGIAGAALALSARESLENLIASFIIFFDKPFYPGDVVKVQNITGTVEKIGLRSTRIRTEQKTYVTVPNKQMVDTIVDNLTLRTQRRVFMNLELSASTSHDTTNLLIANIKNIIKANDTIQSSSVVLTEISKNSFVIQVEYFTGAIAMESFNQVRQAINLAIINVIETMKIKLAGKETEVIVTTNEKRSDPE